MVSRQLTPNDILPLLSDYLQKAGLKEVAEQLLKHCDEQNTSLHKHSLVKMIKSYIKGKPQLLQEYTNEQELLDQEEKPQQIVQKDSKKRHILPDEKEEQPRKKVLFQTPDTQQITQLEKFEVKQRFGNEHLFELLGNERLQCGRGGSYKNEKIKLKQRDFQGLGQINVNTINSIKL